MGRKQLPQGCVYDSEDEVEVTELKRGRPTTTGGLDKKATAQERWNAAMKVKTELEAEKFILDRMKVIMSGEPDMGTGDWSVEGLELTGGVKEAPTAELAKELLQVLETIRVAGVKSKNLKGTTQRSLKMAHQIGSVVTMELVARAVGSSSAAALLRLRHLPRLRSMSLFRRLLSRSGGKRGPNCWSGWPCWRGRWREVLGMDG